MRVLGIVEEDTRRLLELAMRAEGLDSELTDDTETGWELATLYQYQAIIISDLAVAPADIPALLTRLRKAKLRASIVVVSSAGLTSYVPTLVETLRAGADDFLRRPFALPELLARVQATSRRYLDNYQNEFILGPATVDTYRRQVRVEDRVIHFTNKEYTICEALAMSRGRTLSKQQLQEQVYGGFSEVEVKIIDVFICKIRHKLRQAGQIDPTHAIETVWGRGYRACDPPEAAHA